MDGPIAMLPVRIPRGAIDGAVVELTMEADGIVTAQIRIPGPKSAIDAYQEASNEIHYLTGGLTMGDA